MSLFFTSDTHFGHARVIEYSGRPWPDVVSMNEGLIERWNDRVRPKDEVWHLGDFAFRRPAEFFNRLHGRIFVVWGNHDDKIKTELTQLVRARGGDVFEAKYLRHEGHRIYLSHYSHRVWRNSNHGSIHLFGHSHGDLPGHGRSMDVGVDANDYTPVALDEVLERLAQRCVTPHHGHLTVQAEI